MTLYIVTLLHPLFSQVREALLLNSMACERLIPVIRCKATSTFDPAKHPLRPLTRLGLSDAALIERLRSSFTGGSLKPWLRTASKTSQRNLISYFSFSLLLTLFTNSPILLARLFTRKNLILWRSKTIHTPLNLATVCLHYGSRRVDFRRRKNFSEER